MSALSFLEWLVQWRILGIAGPHVLSSIVLMAGCGYVGMFKLKRSAIWKVTFMLPFLVTFAFMLHELFFNPIVDLWNVFTDPAIILAGYEQLSYPTILMLMAVFELGVWWYFFQGEFHIGQARWWWVLWGGYCILWWVLGFHTSLPFWFQSSIGWPWLHDPGASFMELLYTSTFMLAFIHCWRVSDAKVRGVIPGVLR